MTAPTNPDTWGEDEDGFFFEDQSMPFVELVVISWCVPCRKPISRGVNHVHEVHSHLYLGVMRAVFSNMSANGFHVVDWEGVI